MTEQTAAELEHEAEVARARISDTADSLRNKMSPGQMIDEATSYFRGSDGGIAFGNLAGQIRDNPIPAALVGIGLAWLFASSGSKTAVPPESSDRRSPYSWDDDDLRGDQDAAYGRPWGGETSGSVSQATSAVADAVSSVAAGVTGAVRSTASGVASAVHGVSGSASDAVGAAASGISSVASEMRKTGSSAGKAAYGAGAKVAGQARQSGGFAQKQFIDLLTQEPLILAALGVAVGAAIGAAFPSTAIEDEVVGSYRDKLRDTIGDTASEAMSQAAELASETYDNVKDAASQAGLGEQGEALVDAVKHVVTETVDSVQSSVRDRLEGDQAEGARSDKQG